MSKKRGWYGRPNPPPLNWDTPDKPAVRSTKTVQEPDEHLLQELNVTLTNENWIVVLRCLTAYYRSDESPSGKIWRQRVRETVLALAQADGDQKRKVKVRLKRADLVEIVRQVHSVCSERGDAWKSWARYIQSCLSAED